jgi:hypothetical protein
MKCGVSECDLEASIMRLWHIRDCRAGRKMNDYLTDMQIL